MKTAKFLTTVSLVSLMGFALVPSVLAGGTTKEVCVTQYGGATECHTETINEEVTHETVNAGVGDNLLVAGTIAGAMGGMLFILAKFTRRAYFLD